MREHISALMDGGLADRESEDCVKRLKEDPELRATWDLYHLIGDSLRGHTAPDVIVRVQERLAGEPTVVAPRRIERGKPRVAWYGLSAAASVAAVALVGWMALPLFDVQPGQSEHTPARLAEAPQPTVVPPAQGVSDYLLAHQRFSASIAIGGIAPYIRTVTEENQAR